MCLRRTAGAWSCGRLREHRSGFDGKARSDFVAEVAAPLPAAVICDLMGILGGMFVAISQIYQSSPIFLASAQKAMSTIITRDAEAQAKLTRLKSSQI